MSEREPEWGDGGAEPGVTKSRLLFIVARGQGDLRAAIEHALWGLPGLEVIEDRRGDGTLLSRPQPEPKRDTQSSPGDPEPDRPSGTATATLAPTLAITRSTDRLVHSPPALRVRAQEACTC